MNKIKCPACGMTLPENHRQCPFCGRWLGGDRDMLLISETFFRNGKDTPIIKDYIYNNSGYCIKAESRQNGRVYLRIEYDYDVIGRQIKETTFEDNPVNPSEWAEYEYDSEDRLIKETIYDGSDAAPTRYEYEYGQGSLCIKQSCYEDDILFSWVEYEYDKSGNLTSEIHYFSVDEVDCQIETIYGDNGFPVKEVCYRGDFSLSWQSEYDENGNRVKVRCYDEDEKPDGHTEYRYDENGNLAGSLSYNSDGSLSHSTEYRYENK